VESGVDSVSMFRGQEVIRQDYVYSLAVLGIVQSRENLANALTSAWQTAYGMSSVQTVYCILAASKGWIKQTYRKIMHTQTTKMIKLCSDILLQITQTVAAFIQRVAPTSAQTTVCVNVGYF